MKALKALSPWPAVVVVSCCCWYSLLQHVHGFQVHLNSNAFRVNNRSALRSSPSCCSGSSSSSSSSPLQQKQLPRTNFRWSTSSQSRKRHNGISAIAKSVEGGENDDITGEMTNQFDGTFFSWSIDDLPWRKQAPITEKEGLEEVEHEQEHEHPDVPFLSSGKTQALAYTAIKTFTVCRPVYAILKSHLKPGPGLFELQMVAAQTPVLLTTIDVLRQASEHHRHGSDTYKRLNAAMALNGTAGAAILYYMFAALQGTFMHYWTYIGRYGAKTAVVWTIGICFIAFSLVGHVMTAVVCGRVLQLQWKEEKEAKKDGHGKVTAAPAVASTDSAPSGVAVIAAVGGNAGNVDAVVTTTAVAATTTDPAVSRDDDNRAATTSDDNGEVITGDDVVAAAQAGGGAIQAFYHTCQDHVQRIFHLLTHMRNAPNTWYFCTANWYLIPLWFSVLHLPVAFMSIGKLFQLMFPLSVIATMTQLLNFWKPTRDYLANMIVETAVLLTLKDAAERDRLKATTFGRLNGALMVSYVVKLALLVHYDFKRLISDGRFWHCFTIATAVCYTVVGTNYCDYIRTKIDAIKAKHEEAQADLADNDPRKKKILRWWQLFQRAL